jgi:hypothetical protein
MEGVYSISDLGVLTRVGTRVTEMGTPSIIRKMPLLNTALILVNGKPFVLYIRTQKKERKNTIRVLLPRSKAPFGIAPTPNSS